MAFVSVSPVTERGNQNSFSGRVKGTSAKSSTITKMETPTVQKLPGGKRVCVAQGNGRSTGEISAQTRQCLRPSSKCQSSSSSPPEKSSLVLLSCFPFWCPAARKAAARSSASFCRRAAAFFSCSAWLFMWALRLFTL